MDVLFTIGALGLMVLAIIVLGRTWPRSSRVGGYRAGRGLGAGGADPAVDTAPPVPEEDDARWRWTADAAPRDDPGGPATPP